MVFSTFAFTMQTCETAAKGQRGTRIFGGRDRQAAGELVKDDCTFSDSLSRVADLIHGAMRGSSVAAMRCSAPGSRLQLEAAAGALEWLFVNTRRTGPRVR
jgi:hypothetical protein